MTAAQKKLRELKDRQSKERQKMAEFAVADLLTDETRAELDQETGTPLERQLRAATVAVETEEAEQRTAAPSADGDAEERELRDLRAKVKLSGYVAAAASSALPMGPRANTMRPGISRATASRLNCWHRLLRFARPQTPIPRPRRAVGWIDCLRARPPRGSGSPWKACQPGPRPSQ